MRHLQTLTFMLLLSTATAGMAQNDPCWTDDAVMKRNPNPSRDHQLQPWPAHHIIGDIFYVGTRNLGSFLITTGDGHILINPNDPETLPLVRASVEKLGYEWTDVAIILGSHAHADHMSATAQAKHQTGARVVVMRQDMPLLEAMEVPGNAAAVDRVIEHGDSVSLGGVTLRAHLTPGHTPGTTTWTTTVDHDGETLHVVFLGGATATPRMDVTDPEIQRQFHQAFVELRSLQCDVPLAPHAPIHQMEQKFARLDSAPSNPFIDPESCRAELALSERGFYLLLGKQLGTLD
ncbi:MBL fold metallo-hydrolase [Elongatibacter sediminis]|uniref:MBL fold metallo-hydrolase n=1 Tax=Elongatibacter sediminis TaxID=3119006 RepID=A0AAW9RL15_9GAMM